MRIALQKIQTFYLLLCLAFSGLFIHLATICYFSDSEIWLLALSKKALSVGAAQSVYYKWFFHIVVFITAFWSDNNLLIYEVSRIVFALIALTSIILVAASFSKIYQKKHLFLPLVLICLTSSLFFNQGFRIRADILALLLHACFLFLVFYNFNARRKYILLFTLLNAALLLTTPKAFIFIILQSMIGLYFCSQQSTEQKLLGKKILISVVAPFTIVLFALSCLGFIHPQHSLFSAIQSAGDFYLKSFNPDLGGALFFSAMDFMYVLRFLRLSLVHTFLFIAWLVLFFIDIFSKRKNSMHSFFHIYGACLLSLILLYNQKLPFFLGPFLTPVIAVLFCSLDNFIATRAFSKWISPLLIVVACWLCWKQYCINLQFNNNLLQKKFISQLQTYKKVNPAVTIYDIIGLLPQDNTYYLFIGPGEVTRSHEILSTIQKNPPDIYLYTYKNVFFNDDLRLFLNHHYLEYSPGVWLKAQHMRADQKHSHNAKIIQFNNKSYWLFSNNKPHIIYSQNAKKDILSDCLLLDSELKLTQSEAQWIAIPLEHIDFSVVTLPTPKFSQNPFHLFRFDTPF